MLIHSIPIKTLPFPTFHRILQTGVFSGGTERRISPRYHSEEMKIFNITFPRVGIEFTTVALTVTRMCPGATTTSVYFLNNIIIFLLKFRDGMLSL